MSNLEQAELYASKNIFSIDRDWIIGFNEQYKFLSGGVNNVIRLLNRECYFCVPHEDYYTIGYITNEPELQGSIMEIRYDEPNHNAITLAFGRDISMIYPQNSLDMIDVANTIQTLKMDVFSRDGNHIVFDANEVKELFGENATMLFFHKPINITRFDKVKFYAGIFLENNSMIAIEDKTDRNKIYISYNRRNNFYKIGRSKNPKLREKTLQAEEPEIHMLTCWIAPKEVEKELHKKYQSKKERGEWFNLTGKDLSDIDDYMEPYRA